MDNDQRAAKGDQMPPIAKPASRRFIAARHDRPFNDLAGEREGDADPENVIAPMNVPMKSSSLLPVGIGTGRPNDAGLLTAATAISTAAMPTSEWNAATSSGICVIATRLAITAPTAPPTAMPARIMPTFLVFE